MPLKALSNHFNLQIKGTYMYFLIIITKESESLYQRNSLLLEKNMSSFKDQKIGIIDILCKSASKCLLLVFWLQVRKCWVLEAKERWISYLLSSSFDSRIQIYWILLDFQDKIRTSTNKFIPNIKRLHKLLREYVVAFFSKGSTWDRKVTSKLPTAWLNST